MCVEIMYIILSCLFTCSISDTWLREDAPLHHWSLGRLWGCRGLPSGVYFNFYSLICSTYMESSVWTTVTTLWSTLNEHEGQKVEMKQTNMDREGYLRSAQSLLHSVHLGKRWKSRYELVPPPKKVLTKLNQTHVSFNEIFLDINEESFLTLLNWFQTLIVKIKFCLHATKAK